MAIGHNLEVIKTADGVIDLGPKGDVRGGEIVAEGTPDAVAKEPRSYTRHYLKPLPGSPERAAAGQAARAQAPGRARTPAPPSAPASLPFVIPAKAGIHQEAWRDPC